MPIAESYDALIATRLLARYYEAADTVLLDGSTPWEVDEAMVEFGYAIGPFTAQDLLGLDKVYASRRREQALDDTARRYIPIMDRMIELGKLGCKTGAGWYRYPGGGGRVDDPIVADLALEEAHFAGITRVDYSVTQIRERLLLAVINEAAELLCEGVAKSVEDINRISVLRCGFPSEQQGPMHYADKLGAKSVVEKLQILCHEDPVAWEVSPFLVQCADMNTCIADALL